MSWDAIGAIGEIVGAFAVVISLLYLSIQLRNQNRESRASATHEIWSGFRTSIAELGDPRAAEVFAKAVAGKQLTDVEHMQLLVHVQSVLRVWEEAFMQWERGRLDDEVWQTMLLQFHLVMDSPPFKLVWKMRREVFGSKFRHFVDNIETRKYEFRGPTGEAASNEPK